MLSHLSNHLLPLALVAAVAAPITSRASAQSCSDRLSRQKTHVCTLDMTRDGTPERDNARAALLFARLSSYTYREESVARAGGSRMGLGAHKRFDVGNILQILGGDSDTHFLADVYEDNTKAIVAFRGTSTASYFEVVSNLILTDAYGELATWDGRATPGAGQIGVHRGFQRALSAVTSHERNLVYPDGQQMRGSLFDYVANLADVYNKRIYITGHSLGAAMGNLFAAYLAQVLQNDSGTASRIRAVYTFNGPRPGNREFADYYNSARVAYLGSKTYRIVTGVDAVSHLAPSLGRFGANVVEILYRAFLGPIRERPDTAASLGSYVHVGLLVWLASSSSASGRGAWRLICSADGDSCRREPCHVDHTWNGYFRSFVTNNPDELMNMFYHMHMAYLDAMEHQVSNGGYVIMGASSLPHPRNSNRDFNANQFRIGC